MEDFVFDIETTSLSFDSKFLCMAWAKTYKGPIHYTTDYGEAYSVLLEAVEDGKQIWGHNMLTFDLPFMIIKSAERCQQWHKQQKDTPDFPLLWALQHNPRNLHDTLVYSRRKFPKRKAHKMEAWAETLIGDYPINLKVEVKNFGTAEAELLKRRCTEDVKAQAALMHYMKVNYDITRSLPEMDFEMEWSKVVLELSSLGVPYDRTKARLSSSKLKAQKLVTMSPLRRKYPEVNFNASKQVDKALKEKYGRGLPVKRDTGNPSFGKDKRDQVCYMFPELTRMYHAREIDSQLKYIEPHDGKSYAGNYLAPSYLCGGYAVYPSLSVVGTRTGRMQYSDPPLQQMSKDIRHVFRAPRGWFLLGMDIVALEMAILGYILETVLGDSCIMNQVKEGLSAKKLTLEAFEPILGNVKLHGSQTLEDFAKTLNYSLLYGTGMATVGYKLNLPMDTSKQRKESIKRVKECVERRFPKMERLGQIIRRDMDGLIVTDMFGSKVHTERWKALNAFVQSSGAGYARRIMLLWYEGLKKRCIGFRRQENIYAVAYNMDEIQMVVMEKMRDEIKDIVEEVIDEIEDTFEARFNVPLFTEIDYKIGQSWAETH